MLTRKIGKVICGSATPAQLMLACVLGAMLGFMPGLWQAMGVIVLLTLLVVVLNANLVVASVVAVVSTGISWLLLPVSFLIGRALLDGPLQPVFRWAINTPVLALFGFEYYTTTGGLVLGALFGLLCGLVLVRGVTLFRRKLASFEEENERYQQWMSKKWVKAARWVLIGGAPKGGYKAALELHGKVVRPLGVAAAAGIVLLVGLMHFFLADEIVVFALRSGLERANGATVDVRRAELSLSSGRLSVDGLAMADPNALDRNLFEAETLTADVSTTDLLRKRMTLDNVTFNDAATGAKRAVPGRPIGPRPEPTPPPDTSEDEKTIEQYLEDYRTWKQRLAQARRWLERLTGDGEETEDGQEKTTLEQRLRQRIAASGYANVTAAHLIEGTPTLTVRRLDAEKVRAAQLDGELLSVHGENLSTHPHLLDAPPRVTINTADSDRLLFDLDLAGVSQQPGDSTLNFHYKRLSVDRLTRSLASDGGAPVKGGTMDLSLNGKLASTAVPTLDLPLRITLHNSTLRVAGNTQNVDELTVPLGLRGPIDNPAIKLDAKALATALGRAGATQIATDLLKNETGVNLDDVLGGGDGGSKQESLGDKAGGLLRSLAGDKDDKRSNETTE